MKRGILVLVTTDAALAHFFIGSHVIVRKFLPAEENVDSEAQDTSRHDSQHYEEYRHFLIDEFGADGFVVVHLVDDARKDFCHGHDADFRVAGKFGVGDGVCDVHFFEH